MRLTHMEFFYIPLIFQASTGFQAMVLWGVMKSTGKGQRRLFTYEFILRVLDLNVY